jgi:hypothetical protein
MTYAPNNSIAPFLPVNQTFSQDWSQFLLQITKFYSDAGYTINAREIAFFDLIELPTGQQWFNTANTQIKRNGFRKTYNFSTIAAGATLNIPHGLTNISTFTHIYGTATTVTPTYLPLPYVSTVAAANNVSLTVDNTNIIIINGAAAANISSGIIVLEYLKN